MGHGRSSNEHIVGTKDGAIRAYSIRRVGEDDRWDSELLQVAEISALLIATTIPPWLPTAVIDRPELVGWSMATVLAWLLVVVWSGVTLPTFEIGRAHV